MLSEYMLCSGIDANEHIQWCSSVHMASSSLLVCCCRLVFVDRISWACKPFHHFILHWCHCSAKKITFWNIVKLKCVRIPKDKMSLLLWRNLKQQQTLTGNGFVRSGLSYRPESCFRFRYFIEVMREKFWIHLWWSSAFTNFLLN